MISVEKEPSEIVLLIKKPKKNKTSDERCQEEEQ